MPATWVNAYHNDEWIEPVCMRKWWGVRDDIVAYLCKQYNTPQDNYSWELTWNDVVAIRDIFYSWCNKTKWKEEGGSTVWHWDLDDIAGQLGQKIADCNKLIELMQKYPGMLVEFYDSY